MTLTLENIQNCGVVGAGGAGFPSHVKFNASAEIIIINAAECEPLLHKDKEIIRYYGAEIINGLQAVKQLTKAQKCIIGIKAKYQEPIQHLKTLLSANVDNIFIHELENFYPAGDEITLVYETTGRVISPGHIPLSVNCIVCNVETILNIVRQKPVITSFLSVNGEVKKPCSMEITIGASLNEAISVAGGCTCDNPVAILGGPMMGTLVTDLQTPIKKTTGGIIVLPAQHPLVKRYQRTKVEYDTIAKSACDQCSFCTELCPRYLLGHPIEPHKNMRNKGFKTDRWQLVAGAEFCCECNLCSFYSCPEDLDPKNISVDLKRMIQQKAEGRLKFSPNSTLVHPMIKYRRTPLPKLIQKLGLSKYPNTAPLIREVITTNTARIMLQQHVGSPCLPKVKIGETVQKGQLIAAPPEKQLGAFIHASIAGLVKNINEQFIELESQEFS